MTDLIQVQSTDGQAVPGDDMPIAVPSGQVVTLQEALWNVPGPDGLVTRFRFVAPAINRVTGSVDFETAAADLLHLCNTFALQRVVQIGPASAQVILSMADRPLPFGEAAPDATQYFEAYRIENGACIWEVF